MKTICKRIFTGLFTLILAFGLVFPAGKTANAAETATLKNTYGSLFGRSGNCVSLSQLQNSATLSQIKSQHNSITLENEMKPDALLGYSANLISVSQAKSMGYYIPSNYYESTVPRINFDTVDAVLKICSENGIGVRAHTLVWHSQTPSWFFRSNYSSNGGYVSQSTMDARMELYIKTVMNHVYSSSYGNCVYAWDVVNEYLHATNSGWEAVYGNGGTTPAFVKRAFQYAYDCLEYYGLTNKVSLFYNDFNTYMEADNVVSLINFINSGKKICNGVGMQSHLGTSFPSVDYYTAALKKFVAAGFEVQITELDVTNTSDTEQANYLYQLMKNVLAVKKSGGNITGLTIWGLYDSISWIQGGKNPLLFSNLTTPKQSYYAVLQAYKDAGYQVGQTQTPPTDSTQTSSTLQNGWYYIKNIHAQKYLQVTNNYGTNGANVEIGTGTGVSGQKWYLTNTGDGYITLKNKTGYMLDVQYGSNTDGANIQLYSANNADAQKFKLSKTSQSGVYGILTKCSSDKRALDVYNFQTADRTNVCQWTYYQNSNQVWVFEPCNG